MKSKTVQNRTTTTPQQPRAKKVKRKIAAGRNSVFSMELPNIGISVAVAVGDDGKPLVSLQLTRQVAVEIIRM